MVGPITLRCDQRNVKWSVSPAFPYSIRLDEDEGLINGQVTQLMESTHYSLTATNNDGKSSVPFSITVSECPHGNPLYVELFYADLSVFRLYDGEKEVFYYEKTRRIEPYVCLPYQSYRYSAMCRTGKDDLCFFQITDGGNVTFTEFKTPEKQQINGTFEMIPTSKPSLFVEKDPIVVVTDTRSLIYIGASTVHTRFAFSPELPTTVKFNPLLSSLQGKWMTRGVFVFNVTCFNSVGDGSLVITVNVDMCAEPLQDLSFSRIVSAYGDTMNLTDASGASLLSVSFSGGTYRDILCVPEGIYFLHLEGNANDGWDKDPLTVRNLHLQRMGDYAVPAGQHALDAKLVVRRLLAASDVWSFHLGDLSDDWTGEEYREKDWKSGRSGEWGRFDASRTVLFRKQVSMDADYGMMMLEVEADGAIELFVNGVSVWSQTVAGFPQTLTFPASLFGSKALLAVRLKRNVSLDDVNMSLNDANVSLNDANMSLDDANASLDDAIRFSVVMRPLMASMVLRSENGVATGSIEGSGEDPQVAKAFDLDYETFWLVDSLPATITYTFGNASVAVNSIYLFVDDWFKSGISEMTVEGVTAETQLVPLASVKTPSFLKNDAYRELRLRNDVAYAGYRLRFSGAKTGFIRMRDIRLRVADRLLCKKKIGLSALETGSSHSKKCPLGKVGIRQMRCEDVENVATWVDDRSACVSRFPRSDVAFVDNWFRLTNVTLWNWNQYNDLLLNVITEQLIVKRKEIRTVVLQDESTENDPVVTVMLRFEVEEAIGDYVLSHLKEMLPELPRLFKESLPTSLSDASIECVKDPVLYEPIHWRGVAGSLLNGGIVILVTALITVCLLRSRRRVSSPNRKGTKKDGQLLLDQ